MTPPTTHTAPVTPGAPRVEAAVAQILSSARDTGASPDAIARGVADHLATLLQAEAALVPGQGEGGEQGGLVVSGAAPDAIVVSIADAERAHGLIELKRAARPFTPAEAQLARTIAGVGALAVRNAQLRGEVDRANLDIVFRLATAAEFRDGETGGHIQRVSLYAETVATRMGLGRDTARTLLFAAPMHDVGKLGVPDAILLKPGPLTEDERAQMQRHTIMGAKVLADSTNPILVMAREIALSHHERWDGAGYPHALAGDDIPLSARIVAIGDVFDALTSRRVYKEPLGVDESIERIAADIGAHFDPEVGRAFLDARQTITSIRAAYAEMD